MCTTTFDFCAFGIAPSNGTPKKGLLSCGWDVLTSNGNGVSLLLDAAGFIPGESQLAAGAQTLVGFTSIANRIVHSDGTGAGLGSTGTVLTVIGNQGRGVAAAISVGMTVLVVRMRWDLRTHSWFWGVVAGLLLLHIPLVMLVPWSSSNTYSRVVLLPCALLDLVIVYNAIRLSEKLMTRNAGASSAN